MQKNFSFIKVSPMPFVYKLILVSLFLIPSFSIGNPIYTVQVAATKSTINVDDFIRRHSIVYDVREVVSDDWIRYCIGEFNNFTEASEFALKLTSETSLSDVFVRDYLLDPTTENSTENNLAGTTQNASNLAVEKNESITFQPEGDTGSVENEVEHSLPVTDPETIELADAGELRLFEKQIEKLATYGNERLPVYMRDSYMNVLNAMLQYPIILFFIGLILFFSLNLISVLLVINYSNRWKNRNDKYNNVYRLLYEEVLLKFLFGEITWETASIRLRKIGKRRNRKIMTSILLNLFENLKGQADTEIPDIYQRLGLQNDALRYARSWLYHRKILGLRALTYLYPDGAQLVVPKLMNSNNILVRAEAQIAYIRLNPDTPFEFFNTLTFPFTKWTQLTAFYLFRLQQYAIPVFSKYLSSEHLNVRNFSLRMITFFQQFEDSNAIISMLDSPHENTRMYAIIAISSLRIYDAREKLKELFENETERNRKEIIKAFKNIGGEEDLDFLESIIRTDNITLKTEVCRSASGMGEAGNEWLTEMGNDPDLGLDEYLAHIKEKRNE